MKANNAIKALNLTEGEVLTLEKMSDRMEFEAFMVMPETKGGDCSCFVAFYMPIECPLKDACGELSIDPCDCKGPVGYIECHPYK